MAIAWRMAHLIVSVLGKRVAAQFGGPAVSYEALLRDLYTPGHLAAR
jgi:hypothetical protein